MMNTTKLNMIKVMSFLMLSLLSLHAVYAAEPVCAEVKIEIAQELTLERQGFDANMKINNELDSIPLEDVTITVNFTDADGNAVVATSVT